MENLGQLYYERGVLYFELEQYEQAVDEWIQAYELGYNKEIILEHFYQCFILPNQEEFEKNYQRNNNGFTSLSYDDCLLDFIPVNEAKFYIYDCEEDQFKGYILLEQTPLQGVKLEFSSVLYTDTWDIREIAADLEKKNYGLVYLVLGELESKFISFFKLPLFRELYMEKMMVFHDFQSMQSFLLEHEEYYHPKKLVTLDSSKYMEMLCDIQKTKQFKTDNVSMKNLLFLRGFSQYGVLRRMIENTAASFRKAGYNTLIIDLCQESAGKQLFVAKEKYEFDAVIAWNAMGIEIEKVRKIGKKFCAIMGDHPIWHQERLQFADKDTIVWYGDWNDVDYVRKYYPNVGRVEFGETSADYIEGEKTYPERKYDLVFVGGYNKPEEVYDQICHMYRGNVLEFVKDFIKELVENPHETYEAALAKTWENYGLENIEDEKFNEIASEFALVNRYIRAYFRDKIIREIIEHDIVIHVSGNGWNDFESEYKHNIVIEHSDWYTAAKMLANAKISLNIMPWFKAGFHDRAIKSMMSGTLLLTDSSEYIEKKLQNMENVVIYQLDQLEALPEIIKYLLSHEEIAEKIAQMGYEFAKDEFSLKKSAAWMTRVLKEELNDTQELVSEGCELSVADEIPRKEIAKDLLCELKEIEEVLNTFPSNNMIRAKDYHYCVSKLKKVTLQIVLKYPEIDVDIDAWNSISNISDPVPAYIPEMIGMQIANLVKSILWYCNE